jgi:hypothetical protein
VLPHKIQPVLTPENLVADNKRGNTQGTFFLCFLPVPVKLGMEFGIIDRPGERLSVQSNAFGN